MTTTRLQTDETGVMRCWWPRNDAQYVQYHDTEWGRAVTDDVRLFEKLCLEGFQAGLSWLTILRKRENFREAFHGFDIDAVAHFTEADVERLLSNAGIVRHRGKIEATINNAACAIELLNEVGSISDYIWRFAPAHNVMTNDSELPTTSAEAIALSKDLKKRGWKFVGPTTVYSFMQSMGLVNDHIAGCHVRHACKVARAKIQPQP